ncbi:hypothetical protein FSP39_006078 [Pinctada imbricata]|uniref:Cation-dependent mannose-6-phosphate receptor n=1 Tax=Pinctada imbricata TaxID=66713 RepID=A0AA89C2N8_PINIB|nr:hypothetical protein FSP39_006078 [Pinctada imbricata]
MNLDRRAFIIQYPLKLSILPLIISIISIIHNESPVIAEDQCKSPQGIDITILKQGIWSFSSKTGCLGVNTTSPFSNCTISISFCQPLPANWCGQQSNDLSVCVKTFNGTGQNETISYAGGSFNPQPFALDFTIRGGFQATFGATPYTPPGGSATNITSQAMFICNQNSVWSPALIGSINNTIPDIAKPSIVFKDGHSLSMTFEYYGACVTLTPAEKLNLLSAGSVLIIIFFVSLTIYFLFGSVFNYCRGYRGKDVIPQSEFWVDLPVLVADGIIFTCRCGKSESQATYDSI